MYIIVMLHTHTHTHPFNGPLSGTTRESQYQKGKTNLDFTEARDSEWQWHQLGYMQVCTSLQTDNQASTALSFYRPGALPAAQPTALKHWRQNCYYTIVTLILRQLTAICYYVQEVANHVRCFHWWRLSLSVKQLDNNRHSSCLRNKCNTLIQRTKYIKQAQKQLLSCAVWYCLLVKWTFQA